jgi:hypothetical protein
MQRIHHLLLKMMLIFEPERRGELQIQGDLQVTSTFLVTHLKIVLTGTVEPTGSFPDTSGLLWIHFDIF